MIQLSQLKIWVTGSNLHKSVQKTRLYTWIIFVVVLFVLLLLNFFITSFIFESRQNNAPILRNVRMDQSNRPANRLDILCLKRDLDQIDCKQDLETIIKTQQLKSFQDGLFVSFWVIYLLCLILLWFGLYFVFAPLSKSTIIKQDFLRHASHDLRTPLAILNSDINLLDSLSSTQKDNLQMQIQKLINLSNNYLTKLDHKIYNNYTAIKQFNLKQIVLQITTGLQKIYPNVVFDIGLNDNFSLPGITNHDIYQLLFNLIDNAARYTGDNTVKITLQGLQLFIINQTDNLRINTSTGLSICQQISQDNNWKMNYKINNNNFEVSILF